jgi:hypothetical protein
MRHCGEYTAPPKQLSNSPQLGLKICDASLLPPSTPVAYDFDTQASIRTVNLKIQLSRVCSGSDYLGSHWLSSSAEEHVAADLPTTTLRECFS